MPLSRPIFLLGMPGSGKTHCGSKLATKLGVDFCDLDQYIEQKENKSIPHIFEELGENGFRPLERYYLEELAIIPDPVVISLGGGTPCFFDNMQVIKTNGLSIYLQMPVSALVSRLLPKAHTRPLLRGKTEEELKDYLAQIMKVRDPFYEQSDITINGLSVKINELADVVVEYENKAI